MDNSRNDGTRLIGGTAWITLAEALVLPTGFVTLGFLTRQLGTDGYGLFALAATLVTWLEWGINSVFSRTTIKFVSEASSGASGDDDKGQVAIATTVLRAQIGIGILAGAGVILAAPAIATLLREPTLTPLLQLFALEIPLVNAAQAHQNILTGQGRFKARAIATAVRWIARLLFIVLLVEVGFSISGAILGSLAAMLADLIVCRLYIQPSLWNRSNFPVRSLAGYAVPLFLAAMSMRVYTKLDLFALKAMGGTAEQAGLYAVAQNLALLGGIMSPALAPVLIATVGKLVSEEKLSEVKALSRSAMRVVLLHLPFAGLLAGAAWEIVPFLFGEPFIAAAPLFAILVFATIDTVMIAVTSAILVASHRPRWTAILAVPLPIAAIVGYALLIPRWGALGAAMTTLLVAWLGAVAGAVAVYWRWQVLPPMMTLLRCGVVGIGCAIAAKSWVTSGFWLLLKLPVLGLVIVFLLWLLGEVNQNDKAMLRSMLFRKNLAQ